MATVRDQWIDGILDRLRAGAYAGQARADVEFLVVEVRRLEELARELARARGHGASSSVPSWVERRLEEILGKR